MWYKLLGLKITSLSIEGKTQHTGKHNSSWSHDKADWLVWSKNIS